jgi:hypothetical protein
MGVADGDPLHLTLDTGAGDVVAEAHRLAGEHEHAGDEVLEHVLEREANGDRADAERCDEVGRRHLWKENGHRQQQAQNPGADSGQVLQELDQRRPQTTPPRDPHHESLGCLGDQPGQNQDSHRAQDLRQQPNELLTTHE